MPELFGTDGLRGRAGEFPLNMESVFRLGRALARLLRQQHLPVRIVTGRDTRESGIWLEQALVSGFMEESGEAVSAGIITTPAISYLARTLEFGAGVVISASHNPYYDNGIKIFSRSGIKIPEDWEEELEKELLNESGKQRPSREIRLRPDESLKDKYLEFLTGTVSIRTGRSLKLVVDCAHGASSELAPLLFSRQGFQVTVLNNQPDGKNINLNCGSLHPEKMAETVKALRADLGVAFDGDADRAIWSDEQGRILNGDHTLFVQALYLQEKNSLQKNTVVATIMSNMGLEKALEKNGLKMVRTKVGDKHVLDEMLRGGFNLGGEQSGHTIFLDHSVAGDGLLTCLKMLEVMLEKGQLLSELVRDFREFPQILVNVPVREKIPLSEIPGYEETVARAKARLGQDGRLEIRYSGTEMLARIMVEGPDERTISEIARNIASVIEKHCGHG
ncbi:MAG: phosphoglucosamine mutase [Candidatus Saccharicenans sp.]